NFSRLAQTLRDFPRLVKTYLALSPSHIEKEKNAMNIKKEEKKRPAEETEIVEQAEIQDADFLFVLKELLDAYRPILEEELKRAKSPEELEREAAGKPPNCDDELALANRIFDKFFTEEVAVRLLPAEARELLGPIQHWRWCFLHIRCCIIFSWLV